MFVVPLTQGLNLCDYLLRVCSKELADQCGVYGASEVFLVLWSCLLFAPAPVKSFLEKHEIVLGRDEDRSSLSLEVSQCGQATTETLYC